jgi:uncharacterized membrane protein (UPF0127 family)
MQKYETKRIKLEGKPFNAIIADTFAKRMIGLMFREKLPKVDCMLFIFGSEEGQGIWMRNMCFPIDVVWIDENKRVVDIKENLKPCSSFFNCRTYYPKRAAKYIIEFNSGTVKEKKMRGGSKLTF